MAPDPKSVARWIVKGEANVTGTLDALTSDVQRLQERVGSIDHDWTEVRARFDELEARLDDVGRQLIERTMADAWAVPPQQSTDGVNVIGYLQRQLGIGDVGRRLASLLPANSVGASPIAFGATSSPVVPTDVPLSQRLSYTNTVAVIAADQFPALLRMHPEAFTASERMIGYCFWELDTLSDPMRYGARLVDEIWAGSTFIRDAFAELGSTPVHHVPIPIAEPQPSDRARDSFEPLADAGDRFVFGVVFDHFSTVARKNPHGSIDAFRLAFDPNEGPLLVVKTLNATTCADAHAALIASTSDRDDIIIWDDHLTRPDHMSYIGHLDALVALHRAEGLGLHLAEAMWLGVPVIATGYSGNLDFMDDTCSMLVEHAMIEITDVGDHYPVGARWADPSVEHAAELMRRLVTDDDERARIGDAGRERMRSQQSDAATARHVAELLGISLAATDASSRA